MPNKLQIKGMITDLTSKVGRKGNRFCLFSVRMPTSAETIKTLIGLQGKSVSMDIIPIQEELFTEDEQRVAGISGRCLSDIGLKVQGMPVAHYRKKGEGENAEIP